MTLIPTFDSVAMHEWYEETHARHQALGITVLGDSQREREHKQAEWERRKQVPAQEPDVGLDPGMPGSRPEPKADA